MDSPDVPAMGIGSAKAASIFRYLLNRRALILRKNRDLLFVIPAKSGNLSHKGHNNFDHDGKYFGPVKAANVTSAHVIKEYPNIDRAIQGYHFRSIRSSIPGSISSFVFPALSHFRDRRRPQSR